MLELIKNHWFGIGIGIIFALYMIVFFVGVFNPKYFEECTIEMANALVECKSSTKCVMQVFFANFVCEIKTFI